MTELIVWTLFVLAVIPAILCTIILAASVTVEKAIRLIAWSILCFAIRGVIYFIAKQNHLI